MSKLLRAENLLGLKVRPELSYEFDVPDVNERTFPTVKMVRN